MNAPRQDLLLLAGKIITLIMQGAVAIGAAVLAISLPFVTIFSGDLVEGFADGSGVAIADVPLLPMAGAMVIALAILVALFLFFGRLRAIIATVGEGEPFVPANAERLNLMAWLLLATQLLAIPLAMFVVELAKRADDIEGANVMGEVDPFDMTGILMVLTLFILARVFRHGAAMRDDLEGTV